MMTNTDYNGYSKRTAYDSKLVNRVRNGADVQRSRVSPKVTGSQCQATECSEDDSVCSFQFSNWEDGTSTCSLSEAEDRVAKAVYSNVRENQYAGNPTASGIYETIQSEVRRALCDIQNNIGSANINGIANTDTPPDLVNGQPVEVVLDIRREYARKLEESEERARKLRADLAIEEQRRQEFSRILKETLPDHQTSNPQNSRMGRKRSTERKRISKRLTEEAMAYFDECVSISTFDGSDFSSPEDPPPISASVGFSTPVYDTLSTPQQSSSVSASIYVPDYSSNNRKKMDAHNQLMQCCEDFDLTADRSCRRVSSREDVEGTTSGRSHRAYHFSFASRPKENVKSEHTMKSYYEHLQKGFSVDSRSNYDAGECNLRGSIESLLFDRVFFSSRLESGSLHLCSGGLAISFSPFGSLL
ncbi:OLC1v1001057C1 [Oldenlandia corymbosa var. corymbosa]|nr:OLC1v1001057C1 [Oldenlandia corymbosa var. corymbosa]